MRLTCAGRSLKRESIQKHAPAAGQRRDAQGKRETLRESRFSQKTVQKNDEKRLFSVVLSSPIWRLLLFFRALGFCWPGGFCAIEPLALWLSSVLHTFSQLLPSAQQCISPSFHFPFPSFFISFHLPSLPIAPLTFWIFWSSSCAHPTHPP